MNTKHYALSAALLFVLPACATKPVQSTQPEPVQTVQPPLAEPEAPLTYAPPIRLKTQHGTHPPLEFPRQDVTVLIITDAEGSTYAKKWGWDLYETCPRCVNLIGLGAGERIAWWQRPLVRLILRKATSYAIYLDWHSEIARQYRYRPGTCDVLVIEPNGRIVLRLQGPAGPEPFDRVVSTVEQLVDAHGQNPEE